MKTVLGIVPVTAPNADATTIIVEAPELPHLRSWIAASIALDPFVPEGHVLVSYSQNCCGGVVSAAVAVDAKDQINGL